jgi:hypothetical protein
MLKRIALTAVIVATAAFAGLGVAKAQSSGAKAKTVQVDTTANGFCPNGKAC